ncbi:Adenine deaminase [Variovorax sp. PBS-H4]|uniref:adenosine deaminase n=1 Tax=Variovorax sp. PBS-H4 TaxID=434008 RepID=UPI001318F45C|nr:adenosine deaminase [Variovorax sp. PBS-H4]VTU40231.1 Adenine deaminase [Variovorax sp. PBS-H4]
MTHLAEFIRQLPKAELHMHLEGSIEPEVMLALAERNGIKLRWETADALRRAYDFSSLQDFLNLYFEGCRVLVQQQDFYDITRAYLRKCAADQVLHAEMFIGPQSFTERGVTLQSLMDGVLGAMDDAHREDGIGSGLLISAHRHRTETEALALLDSIMPWQDRVAGIGMGGPEVGNPPSKFVSFFAECKRRGFKTSIHAGEEGPAAYVREAIELLNVDRVDHGNAALNDPSLVELLRQRQIPLTVCPLSNLRLKGVRSLELHPLRRMLEKGLFVTVNSDDPPYFGGYVNENLIEVQRCLGLSREDILTLAKNSFRAAFIDETAKSRFVASIDDYVAHHPLP